MIGLCHDDFIIDQYRHRVEIHCSNIFMTEVLNENQGGLMTGYMLLRQPTLCRALMVIQISAEVNSPFVHQTRLKSGCQDRIAVLDTELN